MQKILTNKYNLPLSVAAWLASDSYNFKPNGSRLSATDLGKSIKQLVLRQRMSESSVVVQEDVVDRLNSRMGHAVHDAIEAVWRDKQKRDIALQQLSVPQHVIDRIVIDPSLEYLAKNPDCIPVTMEKRTSKEIDGFTISGQFDFCMDGQLEDFKTTKTYKFTSQKISDFQLQGSIYLWLNPELITSDTTDINYLFKDWSKNNTYKNAKYPPSPAHTQSIPLWTPAETEAFIRRKIANIRMYAHLPEDELPECTPEELWQDPPQYKYFSKADNKTASKVFGTDVRAAHAHLRDRGGKGIIRTVLSEAKACHYCDSKNTCKQAAALRQQGLLK